MQPLPVDDVLPEVIDALRKAGALVLVAPPGAGKTTRVPPAILRANLLSAEHPNVVMLQPRRVAARTVAARIAFENQWTLGEEVGYHVRFDRRVGPRTRLRILTEGILTRQLLDDPFLTGVGAVLLDEFHERSLNVDLCIALLREVQQSVRPDLKLVIMSATLEAEPAATFLGGCPIVVAEGRTFPIDIGYSARTGVSLVGGAAQAILEQLEMDADGHMLVFLPGADEIRRVQQAISSTAERRGFQLLPLYGALSPEAQDRAVRSSRIRKIVLATNIAETSLTIDGVRTVIDTGVSRQSGYDPRRGLDRLDLLPISQASATQRAGRAGRTGPGVCIRLWSEKQHHALLPFTPPEVHRVDLAGALLQLHAWGVRDAQTFGWYERPDSPALTAADRLLRRLGAVQTDGSLSAMGRSMAGIAAHPRLARLLIAAADLGAPNAGATLAALLAERDIIVRDRSSRIPTTIGSSDVLLRLEKLQQAEQRRFAASLFDEGIDPQAARTVAQARDDLLRSMRQSPGGRTALTDDDLLRLLLLAYPDRVVKRREADPAAGRMVGGAGVRLASESVVRRSDFYVAIDLFHDPRQPNGEALVRIASSIEPQWLGELLPQWVRQEKILRFDSVRQKVVATQTTFYLDLPISEADVAVDLALAGSVLAEALSPTAPNRFRADPDAADLLARINLLHTHLPEHPWPTFDDVLLTDIFCQLCEGSRSVEELDRKSLASALAEQLPYPLDRLLEQHAPKTITVPTGNRIAVVYTVDQPPVLAVRLQELFGWPATPTVAAGRVRVRLHLLGPNYRPVQITDDLENFWANTYFQVRKELRARYPKHSWPDDPLNAPAVAKGRATRR